MMAGNLLDLHEKKRFGEWLDMQIHSSSMMVGQFEKMKAPQALIDKEKREMVACRIVLDMINSGEDITLNA